MFTQGKDQLKGSKT